MGSNATRIDELIEIRANRKKTIESIREENRLDKVEQDRLILEDRIEEATLQLQKLADASGRTLDEEAEFWVNRTHDADGHGRMDPGRAIFARLYLGRRGTARDL